jgi:hypothetical protein
MISRLPPGDNRRGGYRAKRRELHHFEGIGEEVRSTLRTARGSTTYAFLQAGDTGGAKPPS